MNVMQSYPDKYFDLAIVDPPYGINAEHGTNRKSRKQFANKKIGWDSNPPTLDYFKELIRVSKNQIIWGANHFIELIPNANSKSLLVWDKKNPERYFADAELAWCSNLEVVRIINLKRVQELNKDDKGKIHPTQKPVALYQWILSKYAKQGDKILDTHLGSGSSRIAFDKWGNGSEFIGIELDKEYFDLHEKRWNIYKSQQVIQF